MEIRKSASILAACAAFAVTAIAAAQPLDGRSADPDSARAAQASVRIAVVDVDRDGRNDVVLEGPLGVDVFVVRTDGRIERERRLDLDQLVLRLQPIDRAGRPVMDLAAAAEFGHGAWDVNGTACRRASAVTPQR